MAQQSQSGVDPCHKCYEWRKYPSGQEHFGYAWWRICKHDCKCEHHNTEVWMAWGLRAPMRNTPMIDWHDARGPECEFGCTCDKAEDWTKGVQG